MRKDYSERLENGRLGGAWASPFGAKYGAFEIISPFSGVTLRIIANDVRDPINQGWEHVSVSTRHRTPNWQEMTFVKGLFWDDEETVIELHPPRARWINNLSTCLHLWKPPYDLPLPPGELVGNQKLGTLA